MQERFNDRVKSARQTCTHSPTMGSLRLFYALLVVVAAGAQQEGERISGAELELLKPLHQYLEYRWLEVAVNEDVARLAVSRDPGDPATLAAATCRAVTPGDDTCAPLLEAHILEDLALRPSFYDAVLRAARDDDDGDAAAPRDESTPRVEVDYPAPGTRTITRADAVVFRWRVAGDFAIGDDGVACVVMRDEGLNATINHACLDRLDPFLGGPQLLSITGVTPGDYAMRVLFFPARGRRNLAIGTRSSGRSGAASRCRPWRRGA